ncbi:hypothetical protein DVH24_001861, partial [Malus domestica]
GLVEVCHPENYKIGLLAGGSTSGKIKLGKKYGLTPVQIALGFVRDRPFVTSSIVGATSVNQLKENIGDFLLTERPLPPEVRVLRVLGKGLRPMIAVHLQQSLQFVLQKYHRQIFCSLLPSATVFPSLLKSNHVAESDWDLTRWWDVDEEKEARQYLALFSFELQTSLNMPKWKKAYSSMKTGEGKSPMQLSVELASSSAFNSLRKFQMEWQILLAMGIMSDETTLIWYSHGEERTLKLASVSRIIPGQRTAVFRRYLRPEKDYLSFSLLYKNGERTLDLICKDKAEAEIWFAGLKAVITSGKERSRRSQSDISDLQDSAESVHGHPFGATLEFTSSIASGRVSVDSHESVNLAGSDVGSERANMQLRTSAGDGFRISVSSTPSCSSGGSGHDDIESLGDVYVKSSRILLSPSIEPVKYLEVKSMKPGGVRSESPSIVRASQVPSLLQLKDIAFPSSLSALQNVLKPVMTTPSQPNSRSTSPYSRRPSPPRSTTPIFSRSVIDSLKKTNDTLTQEVSKMQNQVKSLKHKCDAQEVEIKKLRKHVKEAGSLADDQYSKCRAAKELVKSITEQMREWEDKIPPEISDSDTFKALRTQAEDFMNTNIGRPSSDLDQHYATDRTSLVVESSRMEDNKAKDSAEAEQQNSSENHSKSPESSTLRTEDNRSEDFADAGPQNRSRSPESSMSRTGQKEVIEQFEPGVYVTLLQLKNGIWVFKRVKFRLHVLISQDSRHAI